MFKLYCFISTIINVADMAVLETHSSIFQLEGGGQHVQGQGCHSGWRNGQTGALWNSARRNTKSYNHLQPQGLGSGLTGRDQASRDPSCAPAAEKENSFLGQKG